MKLNEDEHWTPPEQLSMWPEDVEAQKSEAFWVGATVGFLITVMGGCVIYFLV